MTTSHPIIDATTAVSFRRVKTFSGEQDGRSLSDLIQEAELNSAALWALSKSLPHSRGDINAANPTAVLAVLPAPPPQEKSSLSQGPPQVKVGLTSAPPYPVASGRVYSFQAPPKIKFGDPITPTESPLIGDCYRMISNLSHSLLIEYLAMVSSPFSLTLKFILKKICYCCANAHSL